jgi:hypothetical protein
MILSGIAVWTGDTRDTMPTADIDDALLLWAFHAFRRPSHKDQRAGAAPPMSELGSIDETQRRAKGCRLLDTAFMLRELADWKSPGTIPSIPYSSSDIWLPATSGCCELD